MVSIYKYPKKYFWALPHIWAQKSPNFRPLFVTPHSTPHISGTKGRIEQQKMLVSIYNVSPKSLSTSVTFNLVTAKIRLLIVS